MQYSLRFPVLLTVACALALLLFLPHTTHAAQITINMADNAFVQRDVTINVGDTIRWVNTGAMQHTATADNGSFDSGNVAPGQSFAATFNAAGSYSYHCKLHGGQGGVGMAGTITIMAQQGSGGSSPSSSVGQFASVTSGVVPLTVSFRVTNGRSGCGATSKRLDFGDGTYEDIDPLSGNTCEGIITNITHTYTSAGSFTARLNGNYVTPPSAIISVQSQTGVGQVVLNNTNVNTNPSTQAQLQAEAQALLNQIALLQQQLNGNTTSASPTTGVALDSSSCPLVGRSLRKGVSGDDVKRLQQFLARDPSIYPEAVASGYYGALTERAVQRWQVKYNIVSSGSPASTGYGVVGPRTAAAIALLCTTGSYGGIPGPSASPSVGGFITVSPISGNAPLLVSVTATLNTTKSCAGATYTLDFGDGSKVQQIPVSAGNCGELNQTFPHTYQYGGTYQIKLSAGAHQTSATVTVAGSPPPQFTPNLPRESFSATPTSGNTPLTVTFAGIVNSNDAGFCAGGCASTLDFGDGALTSVNLPASVGGWLNYSVAHTYTASGGFRATLYQGGAGLSQPIVGSATIIVGAGTPPPGGTGGYAYSPPTVTSAGGDSLTFTASFDLPSSCTGFKFSWGDGTPEEIQNDGGAGCAQSPALKTFQHTYSAGGDFTMVLKRGATLSRIDDISLTISN